MRIRWRLALYGAVVSAITMIVFGLLLLVLAGGAVRSDQDRLLEVLADEAVRAVDAVPQGAFPPPAPLVPIDPSASTEPFVTITDADLIAVYSTGVLGGELPVFPASFLLEAQSGGTARLTVFVESEELRLFARTIEGAPGVVVTAQSTRFRTDQVETFGGVIAFAGFVTLIVSSIAAFFVGRRAMRPFRMLAETTDDIGTTGDLSKRLPPVRAKDELGALTRSFNAMLDQLQAARISLESSLDRQRRFVADASHELRSPLTTIRSNSGFLVEHPDAESSDRQEAVADIAAEADRMAGLVDDLLTLAIADSGVDSPRTAVDVAAIVDDAARRAERAGATVDVFGDDRAVVTGDREALERLVWILVDNAMKHGDGTVELTTAADERSVRLTVADTGTGLPSGDTQKVFERFYRVDPARSPSGSGLGLAIAAEIARLHRATIAAANRPDSGAEFTVVFPPA